MRILLAGEGKTELGEWAKEPPFRERPGQKGVLAALIERVDGGASVVDGVLWKSIRKYQAGMRASPEERNVLGLALGARRARCEAVVFSRDRDGNEARQRDLEAGIRRANEIFPDLEVVGGIATENIEGWILVLLGVSGEDISPKKTKPELETRFGIAGLHAKVEAVAQASLDTVRPGSLSRWLDRARSAVARTHG